VRILDLTAPRVPDKEPTVYHIAQIHQILAACNPGVPTEDLVVRILVGSGLRRAEICGLAVSCPDGLSDVMTDSLGRGRVELRVRWDAGAKGRKSRRVPITPSWRRRSSATKHDCDQIQSYRSCSSTNTAAHFRMAESRAS
jgi:integrase